MAEHSNLLDASQECVEHAKKLTRAAKTVLEIERLPNVAYHLCVLALEEIGKSELYGMMNASKSRGEDFVWGERRLDDHKAKLFWAIFSPNILSKDFTNKDIEEAKVFADKLHSKRLQALYVSHELQGKTVEDIINKEEVDGLLRLAEARINLVGEPRKQPLNSEEKELLEWFMEAAEHPEKSKFMFSRKSSKKRAELNDAHVWIGWLKAEWDRDRDQSRALLEAELSRPRPEGSEHDKDK